MAVKPQPKFNAALRADYAAKWESATIDPSKTALVNAGAKKIMTHRARYAAVQELTGVPWYVVGITHVMESSGNFKTHLHNGDPLSRKTVQVPAGRPLTPGPWTWEESAVDALRMKGLHTLKKSDWTIERILYELERFNGFGYRLYHPATDSPYLWSYTNHADPGKYIADGVWSATAISKQTGAVALLLQLDITHPDIQMPNAVTPVAVVAKDRGVLALASAAVVYLGSVVTGWLQPIADGANAIVTAIPQVVSAAREPIDGAAQLTGWLGLNTLPNVGGAIALACLTLAAIEYWKRVRK